MYYRVFQRLRVCDVCDPAVLVIGSEVAEDQVESSWWMVSSWAMQITRDCGWRDVRLGAEVIEAE